MAEGKKVLIYAPEFATMGGIERHVIEVATLLLENGFQVGLVSTSNSLDDAATLKLRQLGCAIYFLDQPSRTATRWKKLCWLAGTFWRLRREGWDWIYTNGQGSLFALVHLAKSGHTRLVHQHHTSADAVERQGWSAAYLRYVRAVDHLLAVSEHSRANMKSALGARAVGKLTCLYPWYPVADSSLPVTHAPADRPIRFFYAGRLIEEKGVGIILKLSQSEELQDCEWHIWGSGPHYDAASFAGRERVHYHGVYRSREAFLALAQGMDAFVLYTRHSEGLPISLLEVTELGLPWIAADRGGCRELALRSPDCVVLPRDFSEADALRETRRLADAIRAGLTCPEGLKSAFAETYHPQTVRQAWLRFFQQA